jgi:hypothetical protein
MKMLVVLGMKEHEKQIVKMFKKSGVPVFSRINVEGLKSGNEQADLSNWFGGGLDTDLSTMFFAFVSKQNSEIVMENVVKFNADENRISHLHAFQLPVEKYI